MVFHIQYSSVMKIFLTLIVISMLIFASGQLLPQSFAVSDTWESQDSGTTQWLSDIHFADNNGWAVGSGTILTTNGGEKWSEQNSGTDAYLHGVHFADDDKHGWVVGTGGTIITTINGGANWNTQISGTDKWLESVHFADNNGWAVGSGTILTTNGGKNWSEQDI